MIFITNRAIETLEQSHYPPRIEMHYKIQQEKERDEELIRRTERVEINDKVIQSWFDIAER